MKKTNYVLTLHVQTLQVVAPSFASQSEIIFFLQIQEEPVSSILLCSMHYKELYKQVKYQSCASCGIKPKQGINLSRHCPNPTIYYNSIFNGDSDSQVCSNDYICSSCYKQQLSIIKAHQQSNQFRDIIAIWEKTLAETTDKLTRAILHSVLYVACKYNIDRYIQARTWQYKFHHITYLREARFARQLSFIGSKLLLGERSEPHTGVFNQDFA